MFYGLSRSVLWLFGLLALPVVVSGCAGPGLLTQGIGDEVYRQGETEDRVINARQYFVTMCRRAGRPACDGRDIWNEVVQAALNDIEERCGGYLASLDHARRDRVVARRAITNIGGAATTIVGLTNPGVKALTILKAAFDFGQGTMDEYYSAVLLSEEPDIVERIVRKLQTQYRLLLDDRIRGKLLNPASAHYVVRGYLRLCLPVTIEAELKAIKLNANYVGTTRKDAIVRQAPALQVLDALPVLVSASVGVPATSPTPNDLAVRHGLCLTNGGSLDVAVTEYRQAIGSFAAGPLAREEKDAIVAEKKLCNGAPFLTVFEKFAFNNEERIDALHQLLTIAVQKLAPNEVSGFRDSRSFTEDTRRAVRLLRTKLRLLPDNSAIDADFYTKIFKLP